MASRDTEERRDLIYAIRKEEAAYAALSNHLQTCDDEECAKLQELAQLFVEARQKLEAAQQDA